MLIAACALLILYKLDRDFATGIEPALIVYDTIVKPFN